MIETLLAARCSRSRHFNAAAVLKKPDLTRNICQKVLPGSSCKNGQGLLYILYEYMKIDGAGTKCAEVINVQ